MSDDLRNRVARAIAESDGYDHPQDWLDKLSECQRQDYLANADAALAEIGRVRVKPLEWEDYPVKDAPILTRAVTPNGTYFICDDTDDFTGLYCEFVSYKDATWYGTVKPSTAVVCDHQHVDDPATLKAAAQADYEARILAAVEPAPVSVRETRVGVPDGQTPLDDNLGHPLLDVFNEGVRAFDAGTASPYHGHSLEHCIHAAGWVQRDLRVALDKSGSNAPSVREAARVSERFHEEQVQIWAQEILEALAIHDLIKIDTYDDKVEAHRSISRELVDIGHALDTLCMVDRADAALAEIGGVQVKPLTWDHSGNRHKAAAPFFGSFVVEHYGNEKWRALWSVPGYCDTFIPGNFATADDAKAAIEARILAAIEPAQVSTEQQNATVYCYNRNDWESTFEWGDRDMLVEYMLPGEVMEVGTLQQGPTFWVAEYETGDGDRETRWFDNEDDARAIAEGKDDD